METDHQPLETIVLKPPKRLQRMLLQPQKYNLAVKYKKGQLMYVADTLSRAPSPEVNACSVTTNLQTVDHVSLLAISDNHVQQIKRASVDDPVLHVLCETIVDGWPDSEMS